MDNERFEKFERGLEMLLAAGAKHDAEIGQLRELVTEVTGLLTGVAESTARLLRIAEIHEHRLDSHDDQLDNLEGN